MTYSYPDCYTLQLQYLVSMANVLATLDKNLYFDASHLAGKTVDQVVDLIEKLSKAGGFEDTLSYVNLPILTTIHEKSSASKSDNRGYSSNEKRQRGGAHQENPKLGRSALISVFDKLVSVNIRHILRLQVDDREGLPHTDAAIERAIRGQDSFGLGNTRKEEIKIESWYVNIALQLQSITQSSN